MEPKAILNIEIVSDSIPEPITLAEYLRLLLRTLWVEGEEFSGKSPFGNSDWKYDIYKALIVHNIVDGTLDEGFYVEDINTEKADKLIIQLIQEYL